jgi:hypothetical protein
MVDPVSMIMSALVAGAAGAASEVVVHDAYKELKELIKRKFEDKGKSDSATVLDKYEQKPEKTKALLEDELVEAGLDKDEEIIKAAQKVKELDDPEGAKGGNVYGVAGENKGTVTQTFNNK